MNKDDHFTIGICLGVLLGAILTGILMSVSFKEVLIDKGFAEYNKYGTWHYKTNLVEINK